MIVGPGGRVNPRPGGRSTRGPGGLRVNPVHSVPLQARHPSSATFATWEV